MRAPDEKNVLKDTFAKANLPAEIEVYTGAAHGWCPPDSGVYNEPQAEKAWTPSPRAVLESARVAPFVFGVAAGPRCLVPGSLVRPWSVVHVVLSQLLGIADDGPWTDHGPGTDEEPRPRDCDYFRLL